MSDACVLPHLEHHYPWHSHGLVDLAGHVVGHALVWKQPGDEGCPGDEIAESKGASVVGKFQEGVDLPAQAVHHLPTDIPAKDAEGKDELECQAPGYLMSMQRKSFVLFFVPKKK